jgi:hypothetical protein
VSDYDHMDLSESCAVCGFERGDHRSGDDRCPKEKPDGVIIKPGRTTFRPASCTSCGAKPYHQHFSWCQSTPAQGTLED